MRDDGSSALVTNIYQQNIDINEVKKNKKAPLTRQAKDQKSIIEAPQNNLIVNDAAMEESDKKLLSLLKTHLLDLLENSYCGFIEQVSNTLQRKDNSELDIEDRDINNFFRLQSFMI